jgi:23S rRNA (cytidine1920-2'-O)/16S rRNA (cytidine1409-2'-O)-methyltransferase
MKKRLDILLVELGFFDTRAKSQANIMANNVLVNDEPITKVGTKIDIDSNIRIRNKLEYVSRGALKIKKAIDKFNINPQGKVCADIGSSTGGFTEVLLKNGAELVYAVDVGTNQLDYKLRINKKVKVMENTNARYLKKDYFNPLPKLVTIDVSFISLQLIFPSVLNIIDEEGEIVALIKPQFEIGKEIKGFNGVVRSKKYHYLAIKNTINFLLNSNLHNIKINDLTSSPIKGPKGNREYFLHLTKDIDNTCYKVNDEYIKNTIDIAYRIK